MGGTVLKGRSTEKVEDHCCSEWLCGWRPGDGGFAHPVPGKRRGEKKLQWLPWRLAPGKDWVGTQRAGVLKV